MSEDLQTIIHIRVLPRASCNEIVCSDDGTIRVKLTAPPVGGRANKALQKLLAARLGVPKRHVEIVSGERSRGKSIRVRGLTEKEIRTRLVQPGIHP